jgi:hypothetical protein
LLNLRNLPCPGWFLRLGGWAKLLPAGMVLAVTVLSLWLRAAYPTFGVWATLDDVLFIQAAQNIAGGDWMGSYGPFVLAKGVFFPIFLVVNSAIGLPLKITEHIFYLSASWLAAFTFARLCGRRWLMLWIFVPLALNPTAWMAEGGARVTRDAVYAAMTVALISLAALWALSPRYRQRTGIALGLLGACYWLTREEGIWLLPALLVLALPALVKGIRSLPNIGTVVALRSLRALLLPPLAFFALVTLVDTINFAQYGVFRNNDFRSRPFQDAYGALARIKSDHWQRYVIFPRDARQKAYSVSPAARELEPYFEGDGARLWIQSSYQYPEPWGCAGNPLACKDEILSPFFIWAFRESVGLAGHSRSATDADAYYRRLADEINTACDSGRIACRSPRSGLAPVWRGHYPKETLAASITMLKRLVELNQGQIGIPPSPVTPNQARIFEQATNGPVSGFGPYGNQKASSSSESDDPRIWITQGIATIYAAVSPGLAAISMTIYFALLLSMRWVESARVSSNAMLMLTALLLAVLSRVGLLGFLEATSMPTNNILYLLPAIPCYILFVVASVGIGISSVRNVVVARRQQVRICALSIGNSASRTLPP